MAQVCYGNITITDITDGASVVSTRELYYLTTGTAPDKPDDSTTIYTDNRINAWTSMMPGYVANGNYYITLETTLSDNTKKWSDAVLDKALTDSNYNINALNVRTKNFFKGTDNTYDGWFVSGRSTNEGLNTSNAETYYYNARLAAAHISLGYNKTPVIDLDGSNAAINLYRFPTISNNVVTTEGTLGMQLNSTNLNFYNTSGVLTSSFGNSISLASNGANITIGATGANNSNLYADSSSLQLRRGTTPNATLDSDGLKLSKGGIEAGTPNSTSDQFIYLSTDAYGIYTSLDANKLNWKLIVGNNFGVDGDGKLYASEAVISGAITANSLNVGSVSDPNHLIYNSSTGIDLSTDWLKFDSTTSTVQIGQSNKSHLDIDYHSMQLKDGNNSYFHVSDFRDRNGEYTSTESFSGNGSTTWFEVVYAIYSVTSITIDGILIDSADYNYSVGDAIVFFDTAPSTNSTIVIEYITKSDHAKAYTLGVRRSGAIGGMSTVEGYDNLASGECSHAEGLNTTANGHYCHSEGHSTVASFYASHAEGLNTSATGYASHAEGTYTEARAQSSHAEGYDTIADESYSHAEGFRTKSLGLQSHTEGWYSEAYGSASHAGGCQSIAMSDAQTVIGKYNKATVTGSGTDEDPYRYFSVGDYAFIIGNGSGNTTAARSNALTVDWNGVVSHYGDVTQSNIRSAITNLVVATNSGATIPTVSFTKKGNVAMLHMTIKSTGAIGGGSNIFQATLAAKYCPAQYTTGVGYYGNHPIIGRITADGAVLVRNVSTSNVTLTDNVEVAFTYILKDYFV